MMSTRAINQLRLIKGGGWGGIEARCEHCIIYDSNSSCCRLKARAKKQGRCKRGSAVADSMATHSCYNKKQTHDPNNLLKSSGYAVRQRGCSAMLPLHIGIPVCAHVSGGSGAVVVVVVVVGGGLDVEAEEFTREYLPA